MEVEPKYTLVIAKEISQKGVVNISSASERWKFFCTFDRACNLTASEWPPRVLKLALNDRYIKPAPADLRVKKVEGTERGRVEAWIDDLNTYRARVRLVLREDEAFVVTIFVEPR